MGLKFSRFLRHSIFGFEDGLVSALGIVAGFTGAAVGLNIILLAVVISMFAGGFSMAAGTYLSSKTQKELYESRIKRRKIKVHKREIASLTAEITHPTTSSIVMFFSFLIGSIVPIITYLFLQTSEALIPSIILSALALFTFGAIKTKFTHKSWIRSGGEMLIIGLLAAGVGYYVGIIFNSLI